ncbi:MAG: hypothetical protein R3E39_06050 [Anaerolineae bacterium]
MNAPNMSATLSAQSTAYVEEATLIAKSIIETNSTLLVTAEAAETIIANYSSINQQLLETAIAIIPPTAVRQVGAAPGASVASGDSGGNGDSSAAVTNSGAQFVETAITSRIRASDGCPDGVQTEFTPDVPSIYAVTKAVTIDSGITVRAEWRIGGQGVSTGSYTTTSAQTNFCIWFPLDAATVPFSSGQWSVQLFANDVPIEPTLFFTIADTMSEGS